MTRAVNPSNASYYPTPRPVAKGWIFLVSTYQIVSTFSQIQMKYAGQSVILTSALETLNSFAGSTDNEGSPGFRSWFFRLLAKWPCAHHTSSPDPWFPHLWNGGHEAYFSGCCEASMRKHWTKRKVVHYHCYHCSCLASWHFHFPITPLSQSTPIQGPPYNLWQ